MVPCFADWDLGGRGDPLVGRAGLGLCLGRHGHADGMEWYVRPLGAA